MRHNELGLREPSIRYRAFDVVAPGCFQLTDQNGYCVVDEHDNELAAALTRAYAQWKANR